MSRLSIRLSFVVITAKIFFPLTQIYADSIIVGTETFQFTHTIRIKTITEKSERINNPVGGRPITYLVEKGARVDKGQVITRFDNALSEFELNTLKLERDVVNAELRHRVTKINNKVSEMEVRLQNLTDKRRVLGARLTYQDSLPDPNEVAIAEGRVRVARMNFEAEITNLENAKRRFSQGLISQSVVNDNELQLETAKTTLNHAQKVRDYVRQPVSKLARKRTTLEIRSADLEIAKLRSELQEYREIAKLQKDAATTEKNIIANKIETKKHEVENIEVTAPISGFVNHRTFQNQKIDVGVKMWEKFNFLELPDMTTLAFKGVIRESIRNHFIEGDSARIHLIGESHSIINGKIRSFSPLAHDLAEIDKQQYGMTGDEYGVKVFDVIISCSEIPDWIRPGMNATAELISSRLVSGPAIPLRFITTFDGRHYISVDNELEEVEGTITQGHLVLDDEKFNGIRVDVGRNDNDAASPVHSDERMNTESLTAIGELVPVNSMDVIIGDLGDISWPTVTWLKEEDSQVAKGDLIAKLDTSEKDREIEEARIKHNQALKNKGILDLQREITKQSSDFTVNKWEILAQLSEIELQTLTEEKKLLSIHNARLKRDLLAVKLKKLTMKHDRYLAKEIPVISPLEMTQLETNIQRQELLLERENLLLKNLQKGASEIRRSEAQLKNIKHQVELNNLKKRSEYDNYKILRKYENITTSEGVLKKLERQRHDMLIKSPGNGIIRYEKIWNSGVISKVSVGSAVGTRFKIMSIPDFSELYIDVDVPEKYFTEVYHGMITEIRIPSQGNASLKGEVTNTDYLFHSKQRQDRKIGLYSSHDPLGETVFKVKIVVEENDLKLKPGTIGVVFFPFKR